MLEPPISIFSIIDEAVYEFENSYSSVVHRKQFWEGVTQPGGSVAEKILKALTDEGYLILPPQNRS